MTAPDQPAEHAHKPNNQAGEHAANQLPAAPKSPADDLRQRAKDAERIATQAEAAAERAARAAAAAEHARLRTHQQTGDQP